MYLYVSPPAHACRYPAGQHEGSAAAAGLVPAGRPCLHRTGTTNAAAQRCASLDKPACCCNQHLYLVWVGGSQPGRHVILHTLTPMAAASDSWFIATSPIKPHVAKHQQAYVTRQTQPPPAACTTASSSHTPALLSDPGPPPCLAVVMCAVRHPACAAAGQFMMGIATITRRTTCAQPTGTTVTRMMNQRRSPAPNTTGTTPSTRVRGCSRL